MLVKDVIAKLQSLEKDFGTLEVFSENGFDIRIRVESAADFPSDWNLPERHFVMIKEAN